MSLSIVSSFNGVTDPDAGRYIAAVEQADGNQLLEFGVGKAINDFVVGCKQDRIWDAIKASCILAGARTRTGALVPLVGAAPTSFNFVDANYDRKTGLVGNGSTKYLDSNTAILSAWQNNAHVSVYVSTGASNTYIGSLDTGTTTGTQLLSNSGGSGFLRLNSSSSATVSVFDGATGLVGANRNSSSSINFRVSLTTTSIANASAAPPAEELYVFARNLSGSLSPTAARLAFYSIGESLDLALLDARVTSLINAFAVAIP